MNYPTFVLMGFIVIMSFIAVEFMRKHIEQKRADARAAKVQKIMDLMEESELDKRREEKLKAATTSIVAPTQSSRVRSVKVEEVKFHTLQQIREHEANANQNRLAEDAKNTARRKRVEADHQEELANLRRQQDVSNAITFSTLASGPQETKHTPVDDVFTSGRGGDFGGGGATSSWSEPASKNDPDSESCSRSSYSSYSPSESSSSSSSDSSSPSSSD